MNAWDNFISPRPQSTQKLQKDFEVKTFYRRLHKYFYISMSISSKRPEIFSVSTLFLLHLNIPWMHTRILCSRWLTLFCWVSTSASTMNKYHEHQSTLYTVRDTVWEGLGLRNFLGLFFLFLQNLTFIFCFWSLSPKSMGKALVGIVSDSPVMGPWPPPRFLRLLTWWSIVDYQCVRLAGLTWAPGLVFFAPNAVLGTEITEV